MYSVAQREDLQTAILDQDSFRYVLALEKRRTERSRSRILLMLIEPMDAAWSTHELLGAVSRLVRETDVVGWHSHGVTLGIIFTETGDGDFADTLAALLNQPLVPEFLVQRFLDRKISIEVFPKNPSALGGCRPYDPWIFDLQRKAPFFIKRLIDIAGSLTGLVIAAPVFLAIAIAVKLTSEGPILFSQERIGQGGRRFVFLKFRSMYTKNDPSVHVEYVRRLIHGSAGTDQQIVKGSRSIYKLTSDPRITPIGRFLRHTSLDELPQLINVLKGEMSLVGPRPPIPYEVDCYEPWHRRRFLSVKPGITGLWQVSGRSRIKFDDMVRMDLKYANTWSLWLDIKILLQTPMAVLRSDGAY